MRISIVIPAYNEERYIGPCLASLFANGAGKFYEVIVVDNFSSDGTAREVGRFPQVKLLREKRRGTNSARECGFREATGEIIAFVDADSRIPRGWLEEIERRFKADPKLVSLSGPYKYYDGTRLQRFLLAGFWWLSAPLTYRIVGYMILGGNFAARRAAIEGVGGFDTEYAYYGDDTNLARRLHARGKVSFRMDFMIYSSARRFTVEGIVRANILYAINFLWEVLFHRPFSKVSRSAYYIPR